jgi:hypothetical protein
MLARSKEHGMTDISSVTSSASAFVGRQVADLNRVADSTKASFASALHHVETGIGIRAKTGFTAGPTYEATTIAGQTKAAFDNALNATKAALHIKP